MVKKNYVAPVIKSERIQIGVFGQYVTSRKPKRPHPFPASNIVPPCS